MCQQYDSEKKSIFQSERAIREEKVRKHNSGEHVLTQDEISELIAEDIMAHDAGY